MHATCRSGPLATLTELKATIFPRAPSGTERWRLSEETLETFIRQYIEGQNCREVIFSWQGGEPTLLGLDFFRKAVELEKRYSPPHVRCENDLQTNGTLLDDEWCGFLRENNFLVGLSLDGPRHLHDACRKDKSGAGSFDRVFRAARLLRRHGVSFNTLSCVNRLTAKHPAEVYGFLRDEAGPADAVHPSSSPGALETAPQFWPGEHAGRRTLPRGARPAHRGRLRVTGGLGAFLCEVFDRWFSRDAESTPHLGRGVEADGPRQSALHARADVREGSCART